MRISYFLSFHVFKRLSSFCILSSLVGWPFRLMAPSLVEPLGSLIGPFRHLMRRAVLHSLSLLARSPIVGLWYLIAAVLSLLH